MEEQSHTHRSLPTRGEIERAFEAFSPLERLIFIIVTALAVISVLVILYDINNAFLVSIPTNGGTLSEGVVGTPRYVNPVLAASDADRDLTSLVYRGLMKKDDEGNIVPDLASAYTVSPDGLTYTFTLKDAYFQDGQKLTSDDVLFTVKSVLDPALESPHRVEWQGVTASAPDAHTVVFTLQKPYAPFLESTTLGILPKHIWSSIADDNWNYSLYNTTKAVGSGLFKVKKVTVADGVPQTYKLVAFRKDEPGVPRIDAIDLHFYATEAALVQGYTDGDVNAVSGIDPADAVTLSASGARIMTAPLPRIFGLFFNQTEQPIFADADVRNAVDLAIDKNAIVAQVLQGYGSVADGPIPGGVAQTPTDMTANIAAAKTLLEKDGWTLGTDGIYAKPGAKGATVRLSFEIATGDDPELKASVAAIVSDLREAGIEALPKYYESGNLNEDIIRPRKFQSLFFGQDIESPSELFALWDSSQRTDPGLNISGYANPQTDKLLESALTTLDPAARAQLYAQFQEDVNADVPAVFVYSPAFIYAVQANMPGVTMGTVSTPNDRFADIASWYLDIDRVWKVFVPKNTAPLPASTQAAAVITSQTPASATATAPTLTPAATTQATPTTTAPAKAAATTTASAKKSTSTTKKSTAAKK